LGDTKRVTDIQRLALRAAPLAPVPNRGEAHAIVSLDTPFRVVFMGSGEIGLPSLRWLATAPQIQLVGVVTQPDKPVGRSQKLTPPPTKELATELGVPVLQPVRVRKPDALAEIRALSPDLIVVMAYGQILPRSLLEMPRIACLNLHASLLPRHRGAAPIQAAILAGDRLTGITSMHMGEGLDTGDIVLQSSIPVRRRQTGGSLHDRLAELGPLTLAETIAQFAAGTAPRIKQDDAQANYAPKLDRDSGRVDWSQPAFYLDRLVRAMNPWPGAYTLLNSANGPLRLKLHRVLPMHRLAGKPGIVMRHVRRGVIVGAGEGSLLLLEVQLEGKRRMSATEFVRGFPLPVGMELGERA
jgi:methionyl-tRNA formyltransferase